MSWLNKKLNSLFTLSAPFLVMVFLLLSPTAVLAVEGDPPAPEEPILKEFFATFAPPDGSAVKEDKDSIGLRVYTNMEHKSLLDWYNTQDFIQKGAPVPMKVGPYDALQEGRTYYISGINAKPNTDSGNVEDGADIYTNVYVFSFSDNPTAETLNIVNQLLSNFALNVNIPDSTLLGKLNRDFIRLKDTRTIADRLQKYYTDHDNTYPKLTENPELGTYLPSYTNSKWRSWQGVLGNLLNYNLPVDPINKFSGLCDKPPNPSCYTDRDCPKDSCDPDTNKCAFDSTKACTNDIDCQTINQCQAEAGYNLDNYWNEKDSTFICPRDSHIYQYETKGGVTSILKVDLEAPTYNWVYPFTSPISTLSYQIKDSCVAALQGKSDRCGDGIVGQNEVCEIGQSMTKECWTNDNYPGLEFYSCNSTCRGWTEGRLVCDTIVDSVTGELGQNNAGNNVDLTIQKRTSVLNKTIQITENGRWGIKDDKRYLSREAAGSTYWIYEFEFPSDGDYGAYVKSGNANVDLTRLPFNNDGCPTPGIQHHFVFYLDDTKVGEVCNPAVGSPQSVTSWVALGNLEAGKHDLKVFWDNDWVSGEKDENNNWTYDSNAEIYKVGIGQNCHEDTLGIGAICIPQGKCGDGKIQSPTSHPSGPEQCDDGKNNGKYGYCNATCSGPFNQFCGNGTRDTGKEVCDASFSAGYGWCSLDNTISCVKVMDTGEIVCPGNNGECLKTGAKYNRDKTQSCSWDCQSYDYCGDGRVNTDYEECEESKSCLVGRCSLAGANDNKYCEKDSDCGTGANVKCVNYQTGKQYCRAPNVIKYRRLFDETNWPYFQDATSTATLTPTNEIKYTDTNKTCQWERNNIINTYFANPTTITCLPFKAPAPVYSPSACGNGIIDVGEVCDDEANNGVICDPGVYPTCTFCAFGCQQVMTVSR